MKGKAGKKATEEIKLYHSRICILAKLFGLLPYGLQEDIERLGVKA